MAEGPDLDCVTFILVRDGRVLAERRKLTKTLDPGALALPGGHVEPGESLEAALARELMEELGIVATRSRYLCMLPHYSDVLRRLHYFVIDAWTGGIANHEAESLHWLPLDGPEEVDLAIDRAALQHYRAVRTASPPP
jgi:8-oxo-dGTP diphosphatase